MTPRTNPLRRVVALACLLAPMIVACSDDSFTPTGPAQAPQYSAVLTSLSGSFSAIRGTSSTDVYAIGKAILHYDGTTWAAIELPERRSSRFSGAWSTGDGELFVGDGDGDLFRYAQGRWSWDGHLDGVEDMWASGPNDVYAISYWGAAHFNGVAWRELNITEQRLRAVTGTTREDVVIVGERGLVLNYDGTEWTSVVLDTMAGYYDVARTPSGRTYVTGFNAGLLEIVDSTATPLPDPPLDVATICADGDVLYAAGYSRVDPPSVDGPTHVIYSYANGVWTRLYEGQHYINDLWHAADGTLFAIGDAGFLWRGGAAGNQTMSPFPPSSVILDAWSDDGAVFLVGQGAYRIENGEWTNLDKEYVTDEPAYSIYGRRRDDIYAVGRRMILHYDGVRWSWVNAGLGEYLYSVWVGPNKEVIAVGDGPDVVEYDGVEWKKTPVPTARYLRAVWGIGERVFVVGDNGFVAVRTDGEWRVLPPPTSAGLFDIWGLDETHVYALSTSPSEICFFDGRTWKPMATDGVYMDPFTSIWGDSPSNLFCVDYYGTAAHFDGRGWKALPRMFTNGVRAIVGLPGRDVLLAGEYGTAIYRRQ